MTITALPTPPQRSDPANFASRGDTFLTALPTFATEANALAATVNADASTASTAASTATTQAGNASTSASAASTSASTASTAATTATTQAGIATTKAGEANASAIAAAASAAGINLASPAAIGNVTPNSVAATTLSASGQVTTTLSAGSSNNGTTNYAAYINTGTPSTANLIRMSGAVTSDVYFGRAASADTIIMGMVGSAPVVSVTSAGAAITGSLSATGLVSAAGQVGVKFNEAASGNAARRAWGIASDYSSFGVLDIRIANAVGGDPLAAGTTIAALSSAGVAVNGKVSFGDRGNTYGVHLPDWRIYNTSSGNSLAFNNYTTDVMTLSGTGVEVTGGVSTTDNVTIKKTSGFIQFRQNDNSRTGYIQESAGSLAIVAERAGSSLQLYSNNTLNATLDASGNLALGVVPSASGVGRKSIDVSTVTTLTGNVGGNTDTSLTHNAYHNGTNWIYRNSSTSAALYQMTGANAGSTHTWSVSAGGTAGNTVPFTQAMTLDASGNLLVGRTATGLTNAGAGLSKNAGGAYLEVVQGTTGVACVYLNQSFGSGTQPVADLRFNNTQVGTITVTSTTTAYNTSSDARLKTNVVDASDAADLIDSLQVRQFDWLSDGSHQRYGFVAQELYEVAPEAVNKPADPDEMMAVDYSKLVPMLVKEIQSLRARVAQLEGI